MIKWISNTYRKARHLIGYPAAFRTVLLEDMPDDVEFDTLYLIGEDEMYWFAAMECPCGCKAKIQLSLLPDDKPKWSVDQHTDHTASLHPSVWRKVGCKSHFWFKKGLVQWCNG